MTAIRLPNLLALALMTGCAAAPLAPGPAPAVGGVHLVLSSEAIPRTTQAAPGFTRARVTIDGPTLAASKSVTVAFRLGGAELEIAGAPVGRHMIVLVDGLDAQDQVLKGARYGTTVDVVAGATASGLVGVATTPRARVAEALLAMDRAAGRDAARSFLTRADLPALQDKFDTNRPWLHLAHPALYDTAAIAQTLVAGAGSLETAPLSLPPFNLASYVRRPGSARVVLTGLSTGGTADVWLDDPASPRTRGVGVGSYDLEPVVPGTWLASAQAAEGALATASVTVLADTRSDAVTLDFGRWEALPSMPRGRMAMAAATMSLQGTSSVVLAGGVDDLGPVDGYQYFATSSVLAFDGQSYRTLAAMPESLSFAAAAEVGGKLFVAGGLRSNYAVGRAIHRFDGTSWTSTIASLPVPSAGMASGVLGGQLYLFGGTATQPAYGGDGTFLAVKLDPDTSAVTPVSAMAAPRVAPASAVWGGKLYVFGGFQADRFLDSGEVYDPVRDRWTAITPMPVRRFGAQAIALGARIYVIGGMETNGMGSDRVDLYDPANDRWLSHGALGTPRGMASLALLGARLYVLGGGDGLFYKWLMAQPEAFKPVPLDRVEGSRP